VAEKKVLDSEDFGAEIAQQSLDKHRDALRSLTQIAKP
jgi:hypothetical protein